MPLLKTIAVPTILELAQAFAEGPTSLGACEGDLCGEEAQKLGLDACRGSKIARALPTGPAAAAGLQPDGVVVSLNGGPELRTVSGYAGSFA
jgi:S1-C subfamily serine protease